MSNPNDFVAVQFSLTGGGMLIACIHKDDANALLLMHSKDGLPVTVTSLSLRCREDVLGFSVIGEAIESLCIVPAPPLQPQGAHGQFLPGRQPEYSLPPFNSRS